MPREEIDDEPVEKTESKWSEIGLQKCYWVSVDIKNSSSAGDALTTNNCSTASQQGIICSTLYYSTRYSTSTSTRALVLLQSPEQASKFSDFFVIFGSFTEIKVWETMLPSLTVTWHITLVQPRLKKAKIATRGGIYERARRVTVANTSK